MTAGKMVALVVLMGACILAVFLLVGRSPTAPTTGGVAGAGVAKGQRYEDSALGYGFEYPAQWVKADQPKLGADATFLGPRRGNFTMGLDVRSEITPTALDVYVDRSIKKVLPEFQTDFKILEEKQLTVNGVQAVTVVYSYRQGRFNLTSVEAVYALGDRKVVLTFGLLADYYEELKPAVEQCVLSFQRLGAGKT
jgi:predicted Zn-dependent protease